MTALVQAVEQVRSATAPEQVWSQAAAYLGQELQTHLASHGRTGEVYVWLAGYDATRSTLVGKDGVVPHPKEDGSLLRQRFGVTAGDVWQRVLQQETPLDIPDWSKEPRLGEWGNKMKRLRPMGVTLYPLPGGLGVAFLGISEWGAALRPDGKLRVRLFLMEVAQRLQTLEAAKQQQQTRQGGEFLTQVMLKCRPQSSYEERLTLMAEQVHQAVRADQTLVYAYDERSNHFILKTSAPRLRREEVVPLAMIQGLYQNLMLGELVVINDASQAQRIAISVQFWQQYNAQALLAAAVLAPESKQLLGFYCCLSRQPRHWEAFDKSALQGVAQLAALLSPLAELTQTLSRLETEQKVYLGIAQAIYGGSDWQQALKTAGQILEQHLPGERWLLLHQNPDSRQYEIVHQSYKKRPLVGPLAPLHELDDDLLRQSGVVITVPNWQTELKLMTWRQTLQHQGVQAVLAANAVPEHAPQILLVLTQSEPHYWSPRDCQFVQAIARQLGVVVRQWYLQHSYESQARWYHALTRGLELLDQPSILVQHLSQSLSIPQVVLVTWPAGAETGQAVAAHPDHEALAVRVDAPVPIATDPLLQRVMAQAEPWLQSGVELEASTRRWLSGEGIDRLLALPIGNPVQGVLVLLDTTQQTWPLALIAMLQVLTGALARGLTLYQRLQTLEQGYLTLACQNWWRQWLWQEWAAEVGALSPEQFPEQWPHKQQQAQVWFTPDLTLASQPVSLSGLLRRASARMNDLINQNKVWFRVHQSGLEKAKILGDGERLELILSELLRFACQRSPQEGRVDIWCQLLPNGMVEVAITDYGPILLNLLDQLRPDHPDPVGSGILKHTPARELFLCRFQVRQMGGDIFYEKLSDNRFSSRLWLPLAL
ncbi:MAG: GAF domain-containing protein [Gloeomargarita sp. DG_1_4_bins_134]